MRIILASNSPRRKEILGQLNLNFEVIPSDFEEAPVDMKPHDLVEHYAYMKAMDVFSKVRATIGSETYIIGSDTIVYSQKVMGKPKSKAEAFEMLSELSGKEHQVMSGLCIIQAHTGKSITLHESTRVWMRELKEREINNYIASHEPMDKAGAYAIQGIGSLFVEKIEGCYFNVVGLPVNKLYKIMSQFGVDLI